MLNKNSLGMLKKAWVSKVESRVLCGIEMAGKTRADISRQPSGLVTLISSCGKCNVKSKD